MRFKRLLRLMPTDKRKQIQKVIDISKFSETEIIEYIKHKYLDKLCSVNTYNMNICAIKYFYVINFNKEFNNKLLPHAKLTKLKI